ncbi:MAG: sensor histidine kinase N-terminal domain-containing protein [Proteobacteria bacterium]|nr:sensor histidine kinase N-terminal domain-containing protein [Pseudomonadota bacterium]
MKRFSIRRRLLLLLLGSLVLVWAAMLGVGYEKAREEIHELADARLQQGARTLMMLDLKRLARLAQAGESSQAGKGGEAEGRHVEESGAQPLAFQIWGDDGQLLLASAGAPAAPQDLHDGYVTRRIDGRDWRSYSLRDTRHDYRVTVLEPLALREHPANQLAGRMGQVLLLALPVLALLIWFGIGQGLRPLARLSDAIAVRDTGNLEPIRLRRVPAEAQALIAALNDLLERLARSLDKERAFTADAAHELRTPLAAIKVQAQVALAAQDEAGRRQAIEQVIAGVDRTTHLAQQLLLLARFDHVEPGTRQAVDLGRLAADHVAQRADDAIRNHIELELAAEPDCRLAGDPAMLATLLDNLIDNAIKYGRSGGQALVSVRRGAGALLLAVMDDGDGVVAADRARLRDRFFRVEGHAASGSGLGLSIVEKIAAAHGGTVDIGTGLQGRGLGVTVRFPA